MFNVPYSKLLQASRWFSLLRYKNELDSASASKLQNLKMIFMRIFRNFFVGLRTVTITICYNKKGNELKTGEKTEPFRFLFKLSKPVALTFGFYVNVTVVVFLLNKRSL